MSGKEDESACVCVTFAQKRGKNETKISRTLVREGFCRCSVSLCSVAFSDLWVCFGGGFQTKKMVLRLLI